MSDEQDPEGFVMMPRWLQRDPSVTWQAKMLYLALNSRTGRHGIRVSQDTLATDCSMSVRAVQRAQAELVALGVVQVTAGVRKDGTRGCNQYRLLIDQTAQEEGRPLPLQTPGSPAPSATQASGDTPQGRSSRESLSPKEMTPNGVTERASEGEDFEAFWATYPRHAGSSKADARRAFARAVRKVGVGAVMAGADRYAEDPNLPQEERFIPHAATWLNQERWDAAPLPSRGGGSATGNDWDALMRGAEERDAAEGRR